MWNIHWYHNIIILIAWLNLHKIVCRWLPSGEGPYEFVVQNTSSCIQEPSWFQTNVTISGSTLRGTFDIKQEVKNVKIQAFYLENRTLKVFEMKNLNCHNTIVRVILAVIRAPYNHQRCTMKPVTRQFANLDINRIAHTVFQLAWYGSFQIRWEIFMPETKLMCLNINLESVKLNTIKKQ